MALGTPADLAAARTKLIANAATGRKDAATMITFLRLVRELGVQDPEAVCEHGSYVLAHCKGKLSTTEYWQLHEDVAVAAMSCGELDVAVHCLRALSGQFPKSLRVLNLQGMSLEARGELEQAAEVYDSIVADHPANTAARRRQIAVHVGRGDLLGGIDAAVKYLDVFQTDAVVWDELAKLYLRVGQHEQALFCLEECLLHAPGDVVVMLKLADVLYAQGGAKIAAARGYYAKVTEMSKGESLRALYGLLACESAGGGAGKGAKVGSEDGPVLGDLARERLRQLYARAPSGLDGHVDAMVEAQR